MIFADSRTTQPDERLLHAQIQAQAIKQLVKDTFAMFPDETELRFSITNIMDELKGNVLSIRNCRAPFFFALLLFDRHLVSIRVHRQRLYALLNFLL